ncbi:hypothetical protein ACFP51_28095 [Streptomyces pratens]|uniref:Uncharacterized protein n=1 Tax=Streptomyces pratens TaxID=887456 RepID=A0ABW1M472_9ACTN
MRVRTGAPAGAVLLTPAAGADGAFPTGVRRLLGHHPTGETSAGPWNATGAIGAGALAGGRLAFQGLFPDVLALGLGRAGEEREQGGAVPGRAVGPLEGLVRSSGSMSW